MRYLLAFVVVWAAGMVVWVAGLAQADQNVAQVVVIGEVHDNPAHHAMQAQVVAQITPRALVFEMLTPDQANLVAPALVSDPARMSEALDWEASGWPDFAMYHPIFAAAPEARIYGAGLPRAVLRDVMTGDLVDHFAQAAQFGLDRRLPEAQMEQRLDLQFSAHCEAMPRDSLGGMVKIQRLRDARLAQAAVQALLDTGGPVAVILGNGHARRDWGVPAAVALVAPDARLWVIGQSEDGVIPEGGFDEVIDAARVERDDPCDAFR